jgi:hypothetical protein
VTPSGDLAAVAIKIQQLSAACDAAQAQLHEAMALLGQLTAELQTATYSTSEPAYSRAVSQKALGAR